MALFLSRSDIQRCLNMPDAIAMMRQAFGALYAGRAEMPQRLAVNLPEQSFALLMPSLLRTQTQYAFALKLITVTPQNPARHLPLSYASILLLDAVTGGTLAVLEGRWLTTMRTGAATALATDLLACPDADILALFGAGGQAPMQVLGVHSVRPLREIRVLNRSDERYQALAMTLHGLLGASCPPIRHVSTASAALAGASLVVCATTSTAPLFHIHDLAPGVHINAIGAFTPAMCEIGAEVLAQARIVVDQREASLTEAGDLLQALEAGLIAGPETWSELGELVAGARPGRQSATEITCFKSVGLGVQDTAVALHVYNQARKLQLGSEVEL